MQRGDIAEAKIHFDQAIALYDHAAHRPLAARFGEDQTVATLAMRSRTLWLLGYPEAALRDTDDALKNGPRDGTSRQSNVRLRLDGNSIDPSARLLARDRTRTGAVCFGG